MTNKIRNYLTIIIAILILVVIVVSCYYPIVLGILIFIGMYGLAVLVVWFCLTLMIEDKK
jgi:Flp pilus assembly protein TadB